MSSAKSANSKNMSNSNIADSWEDSLEEGWESAINTSTDVNTSSSWDEPPPVKNDVPPPPIKEEKEQDIIIKRSSFDTMGIKDSILRRIYSAGYKLPRTHQKSAIPTAIKLYNEATTKGQTPPHLLVCAPTSSGKTLSYVTSASNSIDENTKATQVIIICKSRELAAEIYERVCKLFAPNADMPKDQKGKRKDSTVEDLFTVALHRGTYNKTNSDTQERNYAKKYFTSARHYSDIGNEQIVVATAGRFLDLITNERGVYVGREYEHLFRAKSEANGVKIPRNTRNFDHCSIKISLDCCQEFVADEVDQLFDVNGNQSASTIYEIVDILPEYTRMIMYSATLSQPVQIFAEEKHAIYLEFKATEKTNSNIEHYYVSVENEAYKMDCLLEIIASYKTSGSVIVFASSIRVLKSIVNALNMRNFAAVSVNGHMSQTARDIAINSFKQNECKIMVTTDLLARGIDIASVDLVINYDLPDDDSRNYQHRAGRAGRAGIVGNCVTLIETNNNAVPPIISKISKALAIRIDPLPKDKLN